MSIFQFEKGSFGLFTTTTGLVRFIFLLRLPFGQSDPVSGFGLV